MEEMQELNFENVDELKNVEGENEGTDGVQ